MISTLIISSVVIGMLLYEYKLRIMEKRYIISTIESELKSDPYEEYRVHLLASLNKYLKDNITTWDDENIHNKLLELDKNRLHYEDSFVEYDSQSKEIILSLHTRDGLSKKEFYRCILTKNDKEETVYSITKI